MDASIPSSAAKLLDLIGNTEAPKGYDVIFGNNQKHLPKKLTSMTISEVIAAGPGWSKAYGSSAAGRYQFMNQTLKSLKISESLTGTEKFSPDLQDRLGYALLDRRGYEKFASGKLSVVAFGLALAQEWASFPVLEACQGAHRWIERGETYYAGDHLNKALITPERVEAILNEHPMRFMLALAGGNIAVASGDASKIAKLVSVASDPQKCEAIREQGKEAMIPIYGEATSHNACAATLCCFLNAADINVPMERGAGALAKYLEKTRGWARVKVGGQKPGDVAVCFDNTKPAGADHIYLVVKCLDSDEMLIADNQTNYCPRIRYASGHGQTAVEYFLRADTNANSMLQIAALNAGNDFNSPRLDEIVDVDEPTDDLRIRFNPDGTPV
ncbi:hypothetical protein [Mesorhizobium huakuii]|uniref:Glycoside hydrolase family 104 protein n=1 Tax=Mesorhizobium huakuii TaxID=28104 RepID=A0A7G6T066_9HYPH|nr:hypothetical protein [Mesorhizobium huakuii]QND60148.1 glycoside hydrolase family 104 protein [Mesorhizobium huakuii]